MYLLGALEKELSQKKAITLFSHFYSEGKSSEILSTNSLV